MIDEIATDLPPRFLIGEIVINLQNKLEAVHVLKHLPKKIKHTDT